MYRLSQLSSQFIYYSAWLLLITIIFAMPSSSQQAIVNDQKATKHINLNIETAKIWRQENNDVIVRDTDYFLESMSQFRTSIPVRIYECLRNLSILRCTKLFVLEKMNQRKQLPHSGNLSKDFFEQFFFAKEPLGSLVNEKYSRMTDDELNGQLIENFQQFFNNRDIKLDFLPGILVKIVPSKDNKLKISLKQKGISNKLRGRGIGPNMELKENDITDIADSDDGSKMQSNDGGEKAGLKRRKNKKDNSYKSAILQMAVPVMFMPAILLGTFLPFILPVLKMATIMTLIMNNSAFIAALIYAARTHINAQEEQHITYGHAAYH